MEIALEATGDGVPTTPPELLEALADAEMDALCARWVALFEHEPAESPDGG